jgi:hypothetical protein
VDGLQAHPADSEAEGVSSEEISPEESSSEESSVEESSVEAEESSGLEDPRKVQQTPGYEESADVDAPSVAAVNNFPQEAGSDAPPDELSGAVDIAKPESQA